MRKQLSVYEISDIMERAAIVTFGGSKPHDYGTGDRHTSIEVHTLGYIADHPGCTVTEIAVEWKKTKSAVSQLVKKLKSGGFIRTQICERDEKQSLLYLTSQGKLLDANHRAFDECSWNKSLDKLRSEYTEEEINTCFSVLKSWLKVVDSSDTSYAEVLKELKE